MKLPIGLRLNVRVNNITDLGVFVDLPNHRHGLIHHKDFGEQWPAKKQSFQPGQELRAVIINNYHGKIALSLKQVNDSALVDPTNSFNENREFQKSLTSLLTEAKEKISVFKEEVKQ